MRNRSGMAIWLAAAVATSAVTVAGLAINAAASAVVTQQLTGTAHAPSARGQARLVLKTRSSGKFSVKAKHLAAGQTFDVVVNKIKVGTLTTNAIGSGSAKFSTTPKRRSALLGFDPRGDEVEVRDDQGNDDLDGGMPDGHPESAIGCCLGNDDDQGDDNDQGDEGQGECEELTAASCTAAGGTVTTATSCLPNPCASTPPPTTVVCCLAHSATGAFVDDEPEVECEDDVSQAKCVADGGTVVQAPSCDAHPCQPVPPPNLVICCVSQGDQGEQEGEPQTEPSECEHITAARCMAAGGTISAATSCEPDPCNNGDHPGGDGND